MPNHRPKKLIKAIEETLDELDLDETQRISSLLDALEDQDEESDENE